MVDADVPSVGPGARGGQDTTGDRAPEQVEEPS